MTTVDKEIICNFCNKSRLQVEKIVEGPTKRNKTLYICNECISVCAKAVESESVTDEEFKITHHTPQAIKDHLDQYVVGQDDAKITLSVAVYNHFKRISNNFSDIEIDKSNVVLLGPSGSGKTMIIKTIAKLFDVPFVIADATTITESGYIGKDATDIVETLLQKCHYDISKAESGIIFLDEIDKITKKSGSSRDVSGEGAQQSLLKIVEGTLVQVAHPANPTQIYTVDTSKILFVASGAFVSLSDQIQKERNPSRIGFTSNVAINEDTNYLSMTTSDDLIKYGLIPEFVGRFPVVVALDKLSEADLVKIITEPKNSLVKQFKALFLSDGVTLDFSDKYIQDVAKVAIKSQVGARGLRTTFEKTLKEAQFKLPSLKDNNILKVVVNEDGTIQYVKKLRKKTANETL